MTNTTTLVTKLHPPWLFLARLVWVVLVLLVVGLWLAGTLALIKVPLPDCTQAPCDPVDLNAGDLEVIEEMQLATNFLGGALTIGFTVMMGLVYFSIAGVIFWRKSDDWMALLVSYTLVFTGGVFFSSSNDALLRVYPHAELPLDIVHLAGITGLFMLFFLFPDGRFVPNWGRWSTYVFISGILLTTFVAVYLETSALIFVMVFLSIIIAAAFSQIYRYVRVSSPIERQQTKWVVVGLFGALALMLTWMVLLLFFPPNQPSTARIYALIVGVPLIAVFGLLLPFSLAFSILRYRLWDIDVLINRGLVYGTLTLVLGLVYFGSIILLQSLFRSLTGQDTPLVIVISTLVIAALFQPLRLRLQEIVDRRFYRSKYDAERTLVAFAETVRDEVDLHNLYATLMRVTEETLQPASLSLWLSEHQGDKAVWDDVLD
jgi:hypothetical protein